MKLVSKGPDLEIDQLFQVLHFFEALLVVQLALSVLLQEHVRVAGEHSLGGLIRIKSSTLPGAEMRPLRLIRIESGLACPSIVSHHPCHLAGFMPVLIHLVISAGRTQSWPSEATNFCRLGALAVAARYM